MWKNCQISLPSNSSFLEIEYFPARRRREREVRLCDSREKIIIFFLQCSQKLFFAPSTQKIGSAGEKKITQNSGISVNDHLFLGEQKFGFDFCIFIFKFEKKKKQEKKIPKLTFSLFLRFIVLPNGNTSTIHSYSNITHRLWIFVAAKKNSKSSVSLNLRRNEPMHRSLRSTTTPRKTSPSTRSTWRRLSTTNKETRTLHRPRKLSAKENMHYSPSPKLWNVLFVSKSTV
jgi:hypothetical protein